MTTIASGITLRQFKLYYFSTFGTRLCGVRLVNSHYSFVYFLCFIGQELDKFSQRTRVLYRIVQGFICFVLSGWCGVFFFLPIVFTLRSPTMIVLALVFSTIYVEILCWKSFNWLAHFIFILQNVRCYLFHLREYFLQSPYLNVCAKFIPSLKG